MRGTAVLLILIFFGPILALGQFEKFDDPNAPKVQVDPKVKTDFEAYVSQLASKQGGWWIDGQSTALKEKFRNGEIVSHSDNWYMDDLLMTHSFGTILIPNVSAAQALSITTQFEEQPEFFGPDLVNSKAQLLSELGNERSYRLLQRFVSVYDYEINSVVRGMDAEFLVNYHMKDQGGVLVEFVSESSSGTIRVLAEPRDPLKGYKSAEKLTEGMLKIMWSRWHFANDGPNLRLEVEKVVLTKSLTADGWHKHFRFAEEYEAPRKANEIMQGALAKTKNWILAKK